MCKFTTISMRHRVSTFMHCAVIDICPHLLCDPSSRSRPVLRSRRGHRRHLRQPGILGSQGLVKTTVRKHPNTDRTYSDAEVRHRSIRLISWHLCPNIKLARLSITMKMTHSVPLHCRALQRRQARTEMLTRTRVRM